MECPGETGTAEGRELHQEVEAKDLMLGAPQSRADEDGGGPYHCAERCWATLCSGRPSWFQDVEYFKRQSEGASEDHYQQLLGSWA